MKKYNIISVSFLIMLSLTLLGLIVLQFMTPSKKEEKNNEKVVLYTVQEPQTIFFEGEFHNSNSVSIEFESTKGSLEKMNVQNNQNVKVGDILFSYKNSQYIEQKDELKYQLDILKTQYNKLKKQLEETTNINQESTLKMEQQSLLKQSKEELQTQLDENTTQQKHLNNQIDAISAKCNFDIKAPFDGIVVMGGYSDLESAKPILKLKSRSMQVVCQVTEKDILKLNNEQVVKLTVLGTGQTIDGKIKNISTEPLQESIPQATQFQGGGQNSSMSNLYKVIIEVSDTKGFYEGFHVQVSAKAENDKPKVPKTAILKQGEKNYVWTVDSGALIKKEIDISDWNDKYYQVNSGINFGDTVVREAKETMKEGDLVE